MPMNKLSNVQLSDSASQALDDYLATVKERLLFEATNTEISTQHGQLVPVSAVLEAISQIERPDPNESARTKLQAARLNRRYTMLSRLYIAVGGMTILASGIYYAVNILPAYSVAHTSVLFASLGVAIMILGVFISSFGRALANKKALEIETESEIQGLAAYQFLREFNRFDTILTAYVASKSGLGANNPRMSLSQMIKVPLANGVFDESDIKDMSHIIQIRNQFVHGINELPYDEYIRSARTIKELTAKFDQDNSL